MARRFEICSTCCVCMGVCKWECKYIHVSVYLCTGYHHGASLRKQVCLCMCVSHVCVYFLTCKMIAKSFAFCCVCACVCMYACVSKGLLVARPVDIWCYFIRGIFCTLFQSFNSETCFLHLATAQDTSLRPAATLPKPLWLSPVCHLCPSDIHTYCTYTYIHTYCTYTYIHTDCTYTYIHTDCTCRGIVSSHSPPWPSFPNCPAHTFPSHTCSYVQPHVHTRSHSYLSPKCTQRRQLSARHRSRCRTPHPRMVCRCACP
jgi:hypothetical protein